MLIRALAAVGVAVGALVLGPTPAMAAGPPVDCGSDAQWDGRQCKITATNSGRSGGTTLSGAMIGTCGWLSVGEVEGAHLHEDDLKWVAVLIKSRR